MGFEIRDLIWHLLGVVYFTIGNVVFIYQIKSLISNLLLLISKKLVIRNLSIKNYFPAGYSAFFIGDGVIINACRKAAAVIFQAPAGENPAADL